MIWLFSAEMVGSKVGDFNHPDPEVVALDEFPKCADVTPRFPNCTTLGFAVLKKNSSQATPEEIAKETEWIYDFVIPGLAKKFNLTTEAEAGGSADIREYPIQNQANGSFEYLQYLFDNSNQTQVGIVFCTTEYLV